VTPIYWMILGPKSSTVAWLPGKPNRQQPPQIAVMTNLVKPDSGPLFSRSAHDALVLRMKLRRFSTKMSTL
jgi:hypothetical protein